MIMVVVVRVEKKRKKNFLVARPLVGPKIIVVVVVRVVGAAVGVGVAFADIGHVSAVPAVNAEHVVVPIGWGVAAVVVGIVVLARVAMMSRKD